MPDEGTTGVQDQAAADVNLGDTEQDATAQDSGEDTQVAAESKTVPLAALESERSKRQAAEAQAQNLQQQFAILNQQQVQQMPQAAQDYFAEQGLDDNDFPSVKQIREYARVIGQRNAVYTQQSTAQAANQRFIEGKSDYAEKVGVLIGNQFMPSSVFQEAMAADPSLARDYYNGVLNTPQAAYRAVKAHEAAKELAILKSSAKEQQHLKQAALKTGPLSPAAVGGGGSVNQSINAGHDPHTVEGRQAILANFQRMKEGDFDPDD